MSYVTLHKYGYQHGASLTSDELKRRQESPASVKLVFDRDQYFFVLIPQILRLYEEIMVNEWQRIPRVLSSIPTRARHFPFQALLVREIQATHNIEGIHSSRREIEEMLADPKPSQAKRFREFANVLRSLFDDEHSEGPHTLQDIRELYDRVTAGEVEDGSDLDGELFRKGGVEVRSESQKVLHTGFYPEEAIQRGLLDMLSEAHNPSVSSVLSAILCHFMFETVHPFYDGNGRTGRVLLGYHLRENLMPLTILSLSQSISERKKIYYDALKDARDSRNFGELTHFIVTMLEFILHGQNALVDDLQRVSHQLEDLSVRIASLKMRARSKEHDELLRSVMAVVSEHYVFGTELGISLDGLEGPVDKGTRRSLSKACTTLVDMGYLIETKKRPRMFTLSDSAATALGLTGE